MLKVSSSLPDIAVLRGGDKDFKKSLQTGGEVLASLKKIGYQPVDVLIQKDGTWTTLGSPTDPHTIFTRSHNVIDTTEMSDKPYHALADKLGLTIHFSRQEKRYLDREDIYRVLRQNNIKVPKTIMIRSREALNASVFRNIWTTLHTPLLIRPVSPYKNFESKLVRSFHELEFFIKDYHQKGVDVHVLTYRDNVQLSSIAVLPSFRDQEVYTPLWVDVFHEGDTPPNKESTFLPHTHAPLLKKEKVSALMQKISNVFHFKKPMLVDFITHNNELHVVTVDFYPSLKNDGRFMKSLATTGVDIGHYIHNIVIKDVQ
ncbi:MAG: hypothetical protein RI935_659 [Candidatus Parcubacteria bacterium]|jgi:hypothetical protein